MPRRNQPPSYRHYKPKNLAVVRIKGKDHYLGKFDSPESWRAYYRLIADHLAPAEQLHVAREDDSPRPKRISIKKLCLAYFEFAQAEYVKAGQPTGEATCIKHALRRLLKLFGDKHADTFGPMDLKMVRDEFIRDDLARTTINKNIGRIKRMYRWAVENELVPVSTFHALATVNGLKMGKTSAREPDRVSIVQDEVIQATLPFMPRPIQAMVQLQRIAGCRPGEICLLRPCDIDQSDEVWCYRPQSHKGEHHGRERRIFLGPKCQEILRPWLEREPTAYCFSPQEWDEIRRKALRKARKTPLKYGNRTGTNRKNNPKRRPGNHYTTGSYREAIERACEVAFAMPKELRKLPKEATTEEQAVLKKQAAAWRKAHCWAPNRIRHTRATEVSKTADLDAARVLLGHSDPRVTETYAERDFTKAAAFMQKNG